MASIERITVDPAQLEGCDGTLYHAMTLWSAANGPVKYNAWQSLYFKLIRDFSYQDTHARTGESQQERQVRIREWYEAIQTDLHGQDHLLKAARRSPARAVPSRSPTPEVGGDDGRAVDLPQLR